MIIWIIFFNIIHLIIAQSNSPKEHKNKQKTVQAKLFKRIVLFLSVCNFLRVKNTPQENKQCPINE